MSFSNSADNPERTLSDEDGSTKNEETYINNLVADARDKLDSSSKRISTQCHECGKSLSSKGALYKHLIVIHNRLKNYVCEYCGRSFGQSGDLKRHYATHTGEKKFSCVTCGKCFTVKSALTVHIRKHTGEKPFECQRCHKRFTISGDLKRHSRIHLDERNYGCTICKRRFGRREHLATHYVTHSKPVADSVEYACKLCSKNFDDKTSLRKHYLKHIPTKDSSEELLLAEEGPKDSAHSIQNCDNQVNNSGIVANQLDSAVSGAFNLVEHPASDAAQSEGDYKNIMFENNSMKEHYSGTTQEFEKVSLNSDAALSNIRWSFPDIFPTAQNVMTSQSLAQCTNDETHIFPYINGEPYFVKYPMEKSAWSERKCQDSLIGFNNVFNNDNCDLNCTASTDEINIEKDDITNANEPQGISAGVESFKKICSGKEQTSNHFKDLGIEYAATKPGDKTDCILFQYSESEEPEVFNGGIDETLVSKDGGCLERDFDTFSRSTSNRAKDQNGESRDILAKSESTAENDTGDFTEAKSLQKPRRKRKSSKPLKISLRISKKKKVPTATLR